jgi:hypothetical protein
MSSHKGNTYQAPPFTLARQKSSTNDSQGLLPEFSLSSSAPTSEDWTREECAWIQLYHELNYTLAASPSAPLVVTHAAGPYADFREYFSEQSLGPPGTLATNPKRTLKEFAAMRNHLVPGTLWRVAQEMKARIHDPVHVSTAGFKIKPATLVAYEEVRNELGLYADISRPECHSLLWDFLTSELSGYYSGTEELPAGSPTPSSIDDGRVPRGEEGSTGSDAVMAVETQAIPEAIKPSAHKAGEQSINAPRANETGLTAEPTKKPSRKKISDPSEDVQIPPAKRTKTAKSATKDAAVTTQPPPQETLTKKKQNIHWSLEERNTMYRCINKYCEKNGVNTFSITAVVDQCTADIQKFCADEPHAQAMNLKDLINRKLHHFVHLQTPMYKDHAMKDLVKSAADVKQALENGQTVSKDVQYPKNFLPMDLN